jgi:hypothetical protein
MSDTIRTTTRNAKGVARAIEANQAFTTSGALKGTPTTYGFSEAGRLSMAPDLDRWRADRDGVTYVVRSYWTPIAWRNAAGEWYVVTEQFSVTTAKHINTVRRALDSLGQQV